jgi:hypothetical protein
MNADNKNGEIERLASEYEAYGDIGIDPYAEMTGIGLYEWVERFSEEENLTLVSIPCRLAQDFYLTENEVELLRKKIRSLDKSIQCLEARQKVRLFTLVGTGDIRSGEAKFLLEKLFGEKNESPEDPGDGQFSQMADAMERWKNGYND